MAKTGDNIPQKLTKEDREALARMANEGSFTGPEGDGEDTRPRKSEEDDEPIS